MILLLIACCLVSVKSSSKTLVNNAGIASSFSVDGIQYKPLVCPENMQGHNTFAVTTSPTFGRVWRMPWRTTLTNTRCMTIAK